MMSDPAGNDALRDATSRSERNSDAVWKAATTTGVPAEPAKTKIAPSASGLRRERRAPSTSETQ
jgi:hypothetical protein